MANHIGACRPAHTRALPGLFRIMRTHITRTRREDARGLCVRKHAQTYVQRTVSVVTKYAFRNSASNAA